MKRGKSARKLAILLTLCGLALGLTGCGGRSLGERAIVKAVYLNETEDGVEAALAVFICEPNSDTASVEGEAKIYLAKGKNIDDALYQAERKQNKKPFYAQNELLLLGPNTVKSDVTPYLAYFEQENAARPNLSVFLTTMSGEGFSQCEKSISEVVREGERIADSAAQDGGASRSIYEAAPGEGKADGWLPVLTFDKEPDSFMGVRSLVLLRGGKADGMLRDAQMQLALLLAGKTDQLAITDTIDGHDVTMTTQHLQVVKEPGTGKPFSLAVRVEGALREVSVDGKNHHGTELRQLAPALNGYLETLLEQLERKTFARGNDVFGWAWWMSTQDAAAVQAARQAGTLYGESEVALHACLTALQQ